MKIRQGLVCFGLLLLMLALSASGIDGGNPKYDRHGALNYLQHPERGKTVHFIFTADSMFEGGEYALDVLRDFNVKASFFFTGNFLRDTAANHRVIDRVLREGHYLGGHGDRHILLADWDENRTMLASADSAVVDMQRCYSELSKSGVDTLTSRFVVPPYEWYNQHHIQGYRHAGFIPVTPSPGLLTYRDYTTPDMQDYYSSDTILSNFMDNLTADNLDGCFILIHLGTQDIRTDKFYHHLPEILKALQSRGYTPVALR